MFSPKAADCTQDAIFKTCSNSFMLCGVWSLKSSDFTHKVLDIGLGFGFLPHEIKTPVVAEMPHT